MERTKRSRKGGIEQGDSERMMMHRKVNERTQQTMIRDTSDTKS